jgi:IS5 family transposase
MGAKKQIENGQNDLFQSRLDQIIDMRHELVILSKQLDWESIENKLSSYYADNGRPALPIRLMIGLHLLKYIYGLSDESVCERWRENPYFQYFTGESFFQHRFPIERSSMSHFRDRISEKDLGFLLEESLRIAKVTKAISPKEMEKVVVDTTVQEKDITFPTDAKLMAKAIRKLGEAAQDAGLLLRQSYRRVAKRLMIKSARYRHAKQHNRARKQEKLLTTRLGRLIRDVQRKIGENLAEASPLSYALNTAIEIWNQQKTGKKSRFSWHAGEVECIGKGKSHRPWEFGCKVSVATNLHPGKAGHFVLHAQAIHGKPYDGHTLQQAITNITTITGQSPKLIMVDKGYKGHDYPEKDSVFKSGQKRGVTQKIKKEMKRRSVIEPIIGHLKHDHRMHRNHLQGAIGDQQNAAFAAAAFNFKQLLNWFRKLFCALLTLLFRQSHLQNLRFAWVPLLITRQK